MDKERPARLLGVQRTSISATEMRLSGSGHSRFWSRSLASTVTRSWRGKAYEPAPQCISVDHMIMIMDHMCKLYLLTCYLRSTAT